MHLEPGRYIELCSFNDVHLLCSLIFLYPLFANKSFVPNETATANFIFIIFSDRRLEMRFARLFVLIIFYFVCQKTQMKKDKAKTFISKC